MADNNVTDLNLVKFHIKQKCGTAIINIEDLDYAEIIKMETEVVGGSWSQNMEELLQNENWNPDLGNAVEQMLNKHSGEVCENCKVEYKDYCMNCGHLIHILDNEMKDGIFLRAMRSIPNSILRIKGTLMEGYGVYALRNIPKGVKFGPYEGLETVKKRNKYFWKIRHAKLVEANGENYCNWMRFINCATTQTKQNLIALQFMGKIYFKTLRHIKIEEELLIYYGDNGYDHLELSSIQYFQPDIEQINENIFKCLPCCFGFSEEKYLLNHNRLCPYKKKRVTEVNSSADMKDPEVDTNIYERANNLGSNQQKHDENEEVSEKVGLNGGEEVLEQDCINHNKINDKGEKDVILYDTKSKQQTSQYGVYLGTTTKESSLLHVDRPYKCNDCSYAAVQKAGLRSHIKSCHMEKAYKCNECSYAAARNAHLLSHIKSNHTKEKPYICNECSFAAVEKWQLLFHIKSRHTLDKPYKCNKCSYAAVQKAILERHINSRHTNIKPHFTMEKQYKCNECSYAAVQKSYLIAHINHVHTTEKRYKCNDCTYTTALKTNLVNHFKSCHSVEKLYKCTDCSYAAALKGNLLSHIKYCHTMEKPYKCNECSYAAVLKNALRSHIKACHTKDKPNKCNECSYRAVRKDNLLLHIKSKHTMEKPYKCNKCSYAAVRKSTLLSHIKFRHTMEKSYKCNECPYAAVTRGTLQSHIKRNHTMEKPYKCIDCSYAAVQKSQLVYHIKSRHTMEKPYKCNDCSYASVQKSELLAHIKSLHFNEEP